MKFERFLLDSRRIEYGYDLYEAAHDIREIGHTNQHEHYHQYHFKRTHRRQVAVSHSRKSSDSKVTTRNQSEEGRCLLIFWDVIAIVIHLKVGGYECGAVVIEVGHLEVGDHVEETTDEVGDEDCGEAKLDDAEDVL